MPTYWNQKYEHVVELGAEIGIKIRERDENKSDPKLNSQITKLLRDYSKKLKALTDLHQCQLKEHAVPFDEISSRKAMIEELNRKCNHLQKCFNGGWSTETRYKSTAYGRGGAMGVGSVGEIRSQQQEIVTEQDEGLESLSRGLRSQQRMGLAMQDEVQDQNVLIDNIRERTSRTDEEVRAQTRRVQLTRVKYSCQCTCALWTAVVLLAIAIVLTASIPF